VEGADSPQVIRALNRIDTRAVAALWALPALLNLAAGVVVSSWPERRSDLATVQRWGYTWLVDGVDVYQVNDDYPDYPPHAIVALSPLGFMSLEAGAWIWTGVNLVLAVLAVYLAVRIRRPGDEMSRLVGPMLILLCWGGFRALLQFSLLALVLALAAMRLADRHPRWSGVCLGLALIKPQIAAPFLLWALFTRRFRLVAISLSVIAAGFFVYCLRAGASPLTVPARYAAILQELYVGDAIMVGLAQVRPLVALASSDVTLIDVASAAIAVALLGAVCLLCLHEARQGREVEYGAPALAAIWSLLTFYHLTYGFILLLPTATLLLWRDRSSQINPSRMFWLLQLWVMFDPRTVWRYAAPWLPPSPAWDAVSLHADRVLMLVLFAAVGALGLSRTRAAALAGGATSSLRKT